METEEVRRMANGLYFVQGCPTCGRRVQVRMEYLGKYVTCHHCNQAFLADGGVKQSEGSAADGQGVNLPSSRFSRVHWQSSEITTWPFGPEEEF